jgi:hypothetical protein
MAMAIDTELEARLARLTAPGSNGGPPALPSADDLDWFLFHSFPGCEVPAERFGSLLPVYERALREGASFDLELLFVRVLEVGDVIPAEARRALARAAVDRALAGGFDSSDAMAALRFAVRALPDEPAFLDRLARDPALEKLRWQLAVDFALDDRALEDYLAISYLRDGDPDIAPRLERFPVSPAARALLEKLFGEGGGRRRIEAGFDEFVDPDERAMLLEALEERIPGFRRGASQSKDSRRR